MLGPTYSWMIVDIYIYIFYVITEVTRSDAISDLFLVSSEDITSQAREKKKLWSSDYEGKPW